MKNFSEANRFLIKTGIWQ